jgi:hypothetical protein
MPRKDYYVALVLAVVAGFVGGCMSSHFFSPEPVGAQEVSRRAKIIEAEGLRLVDQAGKIRAAFEMGPDGSVGLQLGNKDGKLRARFLVDGNGSTILDLKDEKSQSRGTFLVNSTGDPRLVLIDKSGVGGALIGAGSLPISDVGIIEERPAGSLVLINREGRTIWRAP